MGRAEVGTPKYIANKMKATGLQRLRWYCQVCEKQCRDENGFKCHTQSESHVRNMLNVGENAGKKIDEYSQQFLHDFVFLLRTGHGEKPINANRFYQEYIANKNHIHLNSTKWPSFTELVKHLGKQGICRVNESEKDGLTIAWIDNSPENLQRQEALRKKARSSKDDESVKQALLNKQIERAAAATKKSLETDETGDAAEEPSLDRSAGSVSLSLNLKGASTNTGASNLVKTDSGPGQVSSNPLKPVKIGPNVLKLGHRPAGNPLRANPLASKVSKPPSKAPGKPQSALERIMMKEQAARR